MSRPNLARQSQLTELQKRAGKFLLIVHHADRALSDEWVFDQADIDYSPIVFARGMSDPEDQNVIKKFKNRTV